MAIENLAKVVGSLAGMLLISGALLVLPAYGQTTGTDCTNGGGGNTTCVANTNDPPDGCSDATKEKKCDTPINCLCKTSANINNPCKCST